ncbi:MAG: carbohydrate ABC transporter permease [Treponema sp.]|jgi:putative aldouronate transport system permease protein|nr:carbohydrate ABC transporter permease [Treponema sp.]
MTAWILNKKISHFNRGSVIFNLVAFGFAAIVLVIIVYPLYFIIIASFSNPSLVNTGKVWLYPVGFTLDGYVALIGNDSIWIGYRNTILYVIVGTFIHLAVNIPAAYALSRKDLVYRKPLTVYFLITMFFSGGLIPTFLTVQKVGLYNTFWVMVLPFTVSVYVLIVARTFFENSIPGEMWEAAEMEGCGNLRFFFTIVLPLSKAIIAVVGLWHAVWQWNSYFNALIYLRDRSLFPLQLILRNILIINTMQAALGTGEAAMIAMRTADLVRYGAIIVSTLPIMCVYPFVQKYFNQGALIGAVKG